MFQYFVAGQFFYTCSFKYLCVSCVHKGHANRPSIGPIFSDLWLDIRLMNQYLVVYQLLQPTHA